MRNAFFAVLLLASGGPTVAATEVDYLRDIKPLLSARCYACHGAVRQKARLRLDAAPLIRKGGKHGPAVVPGKSGESLLIEAVLGNDRPRMPPEQEGTGLAEKEIALLRAWIDSGARMTDEAIPGDPRDHWAFRPPVRPPVPRTLDAAQPANPVDAFVAAELNRHDLTANPPAEKAVLLRRVSLDLIGLPPTRAELHAFLADTSQLAYEKVVDRLLSSPRYGERWGRHWMDVWRYSDPFGFGEEYRYSQRHIWRWRDWILESLNVDKGYDRMIVEMLAGDEVAPADPDTLRATGYLARNWYKFNRNAWLQDTVEYTAAGFLGITLRCARCHDHKYDPLAQQDYYRFRAFFEPHDIRIDSRPGQPDTKKDGIARAFDARFDTPTYLFRRGDERTPDKSRALTPGVPAVLGGDLTVHPVRFTAHDFAQAFGPAVEEARRLARADLARADAEIDKAEQAVRAAPVVLLKQAKIAAAVAAAKQRTARAVLEAVEARAAAERADCVDPKDESHRKALALAAAKAERRATALRAAEEVLRLEQAVLASAKKGRAGAEKKLAAARKAAADAAAVAVNKEDPTYTPLTTINRAGSTGRRLALARWIANRDNPLTARVAVNHIWMRHFGKPLVATVANFGLNGKSPTHPALLDYLAVEFMESGWSMKRLHRLLVTSAAYRRSSRTDSACLAADPDNRYLWRMNARRMESEAVRDSLLSAAGQLDPTPGGPILDEKLGQTSRRRSLYFRFNTEYRMRFLDPFDPASPTECFERRESVLPQQALALFNSALALNESRRIARRLAAECATPEAFVTAAFEQVLNRPPSDRERSRSERFLREQADLFGLPAKLTPFPTGPDAVTPPAADPAGRARENLIQVLFNHNDFVTIR
jgi:hypothetical protein